MPCATSWIRGYDHKSNINRGREMKNILMTTAVLALFAGPALAAGEITVVRAIDSNNYDPHKSTAQANAEILFMLGDTLVSLAPDMKTLDTGIAKEWEVSDDGLTYTF